MRGTVKETDVIVPTLRFVKHKTFCATGSMPISNISISYFAFVLFAWLLFFTSVGSQFSVVILQNCFSEFSFLKLKFRTF